MFKNKIGRMKKIKLVLLTLVMSIFFGIISQAQAYDMPIGIPEPAWGINETRPVRPQNWDAEVLGYYYIEDVGGCSDSLTYGHPGSPRCSIPDPIPAGSVVEVHGTYTRQQANYVKIHSNGTSSEPVWLVGENAESKPLFTHGILPYDGYLYIEDLEIFTTNTNGTCLLLKTDINDSRYPHHIMMRNCLLRSDYNNRSAAVGISTKNHQTERGHDFIIEGCEAYGFGKTFPQADYDFDAHSFSIKSYSDDVWVLNNTIHDNAGAGVAVGDEGPNFDKDDLHRIYIGRNHVYNNLQANIAVKDATDVIFSQNTLHDPISRWHDGVYGSNVDSPAKNVGYKGQPEAFWVINNIGLGASYGVHGGATVDNEQFPIYIIGNTFSDIRINRSASPTTGRGSWDEAGISLVRGGYDYAMYNSINNAPIGISCAGPGGSSQHNYNYYIENNIVSNIYMAHMVFCSRDNPDGTHFKNNIIYQGDGSTELIRWGGTDYSSLSSWQSASGECTGCTKQDPQFINADNLRLQSTSPVIGGGLPESQLALNVFQKFQNDYGLDIRHDIDNKTRPISTTYDVGAYEYQQDSGPVMIGAHRYELPNTSTSTTITVDTNVNASCRWSFFHDLPYAEMPHQMTGLETSHTALIDHLETNENGTTFPVFVKCNDGSNTNIVNFQTNIHLAPMEIDFSLFNNRQTECEYFYGDYNANTGICSSSAQEIRADVDQNSTINSTDAMLTLRNSLGLDMSSTNWVTGIHTGDVNCDDITNSTDAMLILRKSLGLDMSGTGWCGN